MITGTAQDGADADHGQRQLGREPSRRTTTSGLTATQTATTATTTGDDATSYTLTEDDVGQTIRVIVTASNDGGRTESDLGPDGGRDRARSPAHRQQPPVVTGAAQQGKTLTTTNGSWDGNPTFAYQWQDCDANGQNCANTGTGATTYALTASDVGHTVQVIVTATDDGGSTQATSNLTATVAAPPSSPPPSSPPPPSPRTTSPSRLRSAAPPPRR